MLLTLLNKPGIVFHRFPWGIHLTQPKSSRMIHKQIQTETVETQIIKTILFKVIIAYLRLVEFKKRLIEILK